VENKDRTYTPDYPLRFVLIKHNKRKKFLKNLLLYFELISLIMWVILAIPMHKYPTYLEYIFFTIFILCFIMSINLTYFFKSFKEIGAIVITANKLLIERENEKIAFEKDEIKDLIMDINYFEYIYNYLHPWFSGGFKRGAGKDGTGNFINFKYDEKSYEFELFLKDKAQLLLLSRRAEEWGAKTNNEFL
jgi:hypothetical protein